jgi:hypothetical protein
MSTNLEEIKAIEKMNHQVTRKQMFISSISLLTMGMLGIVCFFYNYILKRQL